MNSENPSNSPVSLSRASHPRLRHMRHALRASLTRVWPTRYAPLWPPAAAALLRDAAQVLPALVPERTTHCLVIFVPTTAVQHLAGLVSAQPQVLVHPDISLQRQEAYISWSVSVGAGQLPLAIWLRASDVKKALVSDAIPDAQGVALPIIWVAEDTLVVGSLERCGLLQLCEDALKKFETKPQCYSVQELTRAEIKAQKYGERPWLFMCYELKNAGLRMAVHWAPMQCMRGKNQDV